MVSPKRCLFQRAGGRGRFRACCPGTSSPLKLGILIVSSPAVRRVFGLPRMVKGDADDRDGRNAFPVS